VAQVFADRSVGAVLVCSSTDTHADLILAAAASKQIFCEKRSTSRSAARAVVPKRSRAPASPA
jgi:hypothetical protein